MAPIFFDMLASRFRGSRHRSKQSVEIEDARLRDRMMRLRDLIWRDDAATDALGAEHWILLIASWYSAFQRLHLRPLRESGQLMVSDGWYYRNIAKTLIRTDLDEAWLWSLFARVDEPGMVVLIDVEPSVAWSRCSNPKQSELGRWDGLGGGDRDAFCAYQQLVRARLLGYAHVRGWEVVPQGEMSPQALARRLHDLCMERTRDWRTGAAGVSG